MPFSSLAQISQISSAYGGTQPLQPIARPCEFDAQYGQTNGYDYKCGSRRNDHDDANQEYCHSSHGDNNAAPCLVCEMYGFPEQRARSACDGLSGFLFRQMAIEKIERTAPCIVR